MTRLSPDLHHSGIIIKPVSDALWRASAFALIVSVLLFVVSKTTADPDLWGHLRFGLDTLSSGLARTDSYSYTAYGQPWTNHEWLSEVLFATAWRFAGVPGLIVLKLMIYCLLFACLYGCLVASGLPRVQVAVLLLMAVGAFIPFLSIRPQMFTYVFFVIVLIIMKLAEAGRYRLLWLMPPIFALWCNLHGGFLAGLGVFGLWAVCHVALNRQRVTTVSLPLILSIIAICANPYGPGLVTLLLRTATVPRPEIMDWRPLNVISGEGAFYLPMLLVTLAALLYSRQKCKLALIAPYMLLVLLPLTAVRHLPLFASGGLILVSEYLGASGRRFRGSHKVIPWAKPAWFLAPIGICIAFFVFLFTQNLRHIPYVESMHYPALAITVLARSDASGNLLTSFGWGEYAIWHLGPRIRVSIDGRRETVYPEPVYRQNLRFMFGVGQWDTLLTEYPTDIVLIPGDSAAYSLMRLYPGWVLVYEDTTASLFVRDQSPLIAPIREAAVLPISSREASFP